MPLCGGLDGGVGARGGAGGGAEGAPIVVHHTCAYRILLTISFNYKATI